MRRNRLERVTGSGREGDKKAQGAQRQTKITVAIELKKKLHTWDTLRKHVHEKMKTILPYLHNINGMYYAKSFHGEPITRFSEFWEKDKQGLFFFKKLFMSHVGLKTFK